MGSMLIKPEQLSANLKKQLPPVIWVTGDETLLVQEACDTVRQMAREQGFTEREVHDVGKVFDWTVLLESANSLSLFADRKIIDMRLHSPKLENDARNILQEYVENPGEDNLLLISSPKVEKPTLGTKWFKAIESRGLVVQVWPVNAQQLPGWIAQRMRKAGLNADQDSINMLGQRVEGNLLAAAQEIDKLALLAGDRQLTAQIVGRAVSDSSRFNVFVLTDACLAGHTAKALSILNHLRAEGDDPLKLLFFITKEIRILLRMQVKIRQGQNINGVMQAERVWQNRTAIVGHALRQHSVDSLEKLLLQARRVDQSVKGLLDLKPWDELMAMVLALAGTRTAVSAEIV